MAFNPHNRSFFKLLDLMMKERVLELSGNPNFISTLGD
jgi:hypothetical protein